MSSSNTRIEWTEATWNPITGCTPVGEGCVNCCARRRAQRFRGQYGYPADDPFRVTAHKDKLETPLHWRKPRMIFVCSMGDLFHPDVPEVALKRVLKVIEQCPQHTFQILTKRPHCVRDRLKDMYWRDGDVWLPKNVWLGCSVSTQEEYRTSVHHLWSANPTVRFVSVEPLLEPVVVHNFRMVLDWVIVGPETGAGARPCEVEWVRGVVQQCCRYDIPVFVKALNLDGRINRDPAEWPADLRVRQWPK